MAEDISKKAVVYALPGMHDLEVRSDDGIDFYDPSARSAAAVILVAGYPDDGFERTVGCRFMDMGSSVSWCRLIAASGMTAVAYSRSDPVAGLADVLDRVRGLGYTRTALYASSGNAPLAVSMLFGARARSIQCAALLYPYTLAVPADAQKFGFATPANDRTIEEIAHDVPLFIGRAGRDEMPLLNQTLDAFVSAALRHNLPITLMNHPSGPHAFDLLDDSARSHMVIVEVLAFFRAHLR